MDSTTLRLSNSRCWSFQPCTQHGMALFVCLSMLLILTILGLASVQTTTLQEQMVRNSQDINIAFLAAESGLVDAEAMIENNGATLDFKANDATHSGLYLEAGFDTPSHWNTIDWEDVDGQYETAVTQLPGTAAQPKYIVEHVKTIAAAEDRLSIENIGQDVSASTSRIFRITVYGTGGSDDAHVMIQSTYGKQF
jgi:type IV pilus assembly protein PilX